MKKATIKFWVENTCYEIVFQPRKRKVEERLTATKYRRIETKTKIRLTDAVPVKVTGKLLSLLKEMNVALGNTLFN